MKLHSKPHEIECNHAMPLYNAWGTELKDYYSFLTKKTPNFFGTYLKFKYVFKTSMNSGNFADILNLMTEVTNCAKSHLDKY